MPERLLAPFGLNGYGCCEDLTRKLADALTIPVIASGGFASIEDVKALLQPRAKKLAGAIAGRALYDGRLDPAAALRLIRESREAARA